MVFMSKNSFLILLGILIVISAFLGVPSSWKTIIIGALGVLTVAIALMLRKDIATGAICMHLQENVHTDSYVQNGLLKPDKAYEEKGTHVQTETAS